MSKRIRKLRSCRRKLENADSRLNKLEPNVKTSIIRIRKLPKNDLV
jgi:hypothetical protein